VYITNTLRLLDLPDEVKTLMGDGRLQAGHARAILAIKDVAKQVDGRRSEEATFPRPRRVTRRPSRDRGA
jgi:ParB-like chromosome segregation protein Spo0J